MKCNCNGIVLFQDLREKFLGHPPRGRNAPEKPAKQNKRSPSYARKICKRNSNTDFPPTGEVPRNGKLV
jgi:hypothetical protein